MMEPDKDSQGYATSGSTPPPEAPPSYVAQPAARTGQAASGAVSLIGSPLVLLMVICWHFFWTTWGNIQFVNAEEVIDLKWLPFAWFFHSFGLLAVGLWAVGDQRSISALMFMLFIAASIFTEWIMFGMYFDHSKEYLDDVKGVGRIERTWHFAWAAALINHLTKYASLVLVGLAFRARGALDTLDL